jgi:hypothetical protein
VRESSPFAGHDEEGARPAAGEQPDMLTAA